MVMNFAMKSRQRSGKLQIPHPKPPTIPKLQGPSRQMRIGLRFGVWCLFGIWILGFGISSFAANSFVDGFKGVDVVDTAVDNLGVTYVLGKDSANNTLIWKYDAVGAVLHWITNATYPQTNIVYRTNSN